MQCREFAFCKPTVDSLFDSLCDQSAQELARRFTVLFGNQHLFFIDRHGQDLEPALAEPGCIVELLVRVELIQFRVLCKDLSQSADQLVVADIRIRTRPVGQRLDLGVPEACAIRFHLVDAEAFKAEHGPRANRR